MAKKVGEGGGGAAETGRHPYKFRPDINTKDVNLDLENSKLFLGNYIRGIQS